MALEQTFQPGDVVAGLRIERELGRGAYGVVYLARDELIARHIALKVVHTHGGGDGPDSDRALREARAVGRLNSPHIVTLHRVHPLSEKEGWVFEMEYVEGGSLKDLLDREGTLPPERATGVLTDVLRALQAAHGAGIVHGDVKPGNVLLSNGRVKLADFGLALIRGDAELSLSAAAAPVGTPAYMAPEVIMGEQPGPTADLWSAGVVFYRMLAGRMPFRVTTFNELFFSVQNAAPKPLPPDVPSHLQAVALALLTKVPAERPEDAAAALEMLSSVPVVEVQPAPVAAPGLPPPPVLFGREAEAAQLQELMRGVAEGKGQAMLVSGEAGIGKTALVHALTPTASECGFRWIEATVTPLEGLLRPLIRAANFTLQGEDVAKFDSLLESHTSGVSAQLVRDLLDEKIDVNLNSRPQLTWALEQLFFGLAQEQPLALIVEDAHHADDEDVKLLRELARRLPGGRICFVTTFRTHSVDASASEASAIAGYHELASLQELHHVDLPPLSRDAIYRILERQAEGVRLPPEIAQRVIELAEGNPLFAAEMLRHLEETGAIHLDGSVFKASPKWEQVSLPGRFRELVGRRLAGLPEDDRAMLDVAAVDGRLFDGEALAAVLERPLIHLLRDLQRLYRERNLVEPRGQGFRFTSTVVQEVIYDELAPALRRALHEQLANHLTERAPGGVDPERLGVHWEQAGHDDKAAPYFLRAAAAAATRQEKRRVVELCERAGLARGPIDPQLALAHGETLLRLGESYYSLGQHDAMRRVYDALARAAQEADDRMLQHRCEVSRAHTTERLEGGRAVDESVLLRAAEELEPCREKGEAWYTLGRVARTRGEMARAVQCYEQADRIFLEVKLQARHSAVLDQLAGIANEEGRPEEAEKLYREAAQICRDVGWHINAAASDINRALVAFARGALDGLDSVFERAARTLILEGSTAIAPIACSFVAQIRYALGDLDGALRANEEAVEILGHREYLQGVQAVYGECAHLDGVRGHLDHAWRSLETSRAAADKSEDVQQLVATGLLEVHLHCFGGNQGAAVKAADRVLRLAADSAAVRDTTIQWLAEAALYGLQPGQLASDPADLLGDTTDLEHGLWKAAVCFAQRDAGPSALDAGAAALAEHPVGPRRAALQIGGRWLLAESLRREGRAADAAAEAGAALEQARSLGHAWLQAGLLGFLHELEPDGDHADRCAALIRSVTENLADDAARGRVWKAWSAV